MSEEEEHIQDRINRLEMAHRSASGAVEELKGVVQSTMYKEDEYAEKANNLQTECDRLAVEIYEKVQELKEKAENSDGGSEE